MEEELIREEGTGYEKKKHGAGAAVYCPWAHRSSTGAERF
jgi:hypothetical protein